MPVLAQGELATYRAAILTPSASHPDMFTSTLRRLSAFVAIYLALQLGAAFAAPAEQRDLEARATPAAPHFAVYADTYQSGVTGPPAVSSITVRCLSLYINFLLAHRTMFTTGLERLVSFTKLLM